MIYVTATIELVPGSRNEFLREQKSLLPLVRAEQGCLEYTPAVDLPTGLPAQGPARPDVVVMHERWESLPALEAHLNAPHMHSFRQRVKGLVAGVRLAVTQPTDAA